MVKFTLVDYYFDLVLAKLQDFAEAAVEVITERLRSHHQRPAQSKMENNCY